MCLYPVMEVSYYTLLQVRLDVDIRDTDDDRRDGVMQAAFAAAEAIAQRRRCGLRTETVFAYPAATSDDKVLSSCCFACVRLRGGGCSTEASARHHPLAANSRSCLLTLTVATCLF